jgi:hypothetical protein
MGCAYDTEGSQVTRRESVRAFETSLWNVLAPQDEESGHFVASERTV